MGRVGDEFIILLEINRVFSVSELVTLSRIAKSSAAPSEGEGEKSE